MIRLDVLNEQQIVNALNSFRPDLRPPMEASLALLHDFMARYPAQPAGSRYRRTGDYGRKWSTHITESGATIEGELGNSVRSRRGGRSYGPYVGSAQQQARWNRHWQTDEDAIRENEAQIRGYFEAYLQDLTR